MGGAASAQSGAIPDSIMESISEKDRKRFQGSYQVIATSLAKQPENPLELYDIGLTEAVKNFSELLEPEEYRPLVMHPSIRLHEMLLELVKIYLPQFNHHQPQTIAEVEPCMILPRLLICFWHIVRCDSNRVILGSKEFGLVETLAPSLLHNYLINQLCWYQIHDILANLALCPDTYGHLLSPEVGILQHYIDFAKKAERLDGVRFLACICMSMKIPEQLHYLIDTKAYEPIAQHMLTIDVDFDWQANLGQIEYWCLNFIMQFASIPEALPLIQKPEIVQYFFELLKAQANKIEGLKAAFVLSFLLGKEESLGSSKSLLQEYPVILDNLILVLKVTLNENEGPEAEELSNLGGFYYGIIVLKVIMQALQRLSISDANKASMLECDVVMLLMRVIKLFVEDAPQLSQLSYGLRSFAGGGKDDLPSAELAIDVLIQLSFHFATDDDLRKNYLNPKYEMITLLQGCFEHKSISNDQKQGISSLLRKLENKQMPEAKPATTGPRKHVMMSYAWAANKPYVIAFTNKLRQLGYDVWRDEDGSSVVGPMSGDTDDVMADAIQHAQAVIICVSPQYKESINCRSEAKYAKARQFQAKDLELIYVMMSDQYHTRSSPHCVDGWLGFMIGTELWYPLWNESCVDSAATSISKVLGDRAKKQEGSRVEAVAPVAIPPAPIVATPAPPVQKEPNYEEAWKCITTKVKSTNPEKLEELIESLGLAEPGDLKYITDEHIESILGLLKPIPVNIFKSNMGR